MLVTPLLTGRGGGAVSLATTLLQAMVVVVAVVLFARRLVPPLGHFSLVRFRKADVAAAA